ncbi:N-acetylneuraminate synthase family protein [uncultured Cohaesibacter sp.]|uniref:N-acetylneuraminate synthase family protein n=1 Tax=uncultured Cohaesibacter sp. TaxID=1002546 RepID=UPI0029C985B0|nr:N-acetylneuraminate synthase family protein [uncultured Cohaesibacter sp.]
MKEEDANLRCIPMLRERYSCPVGYSGHETSLVKVCVAAVALGGDVAGASHHTRPGGCMDRIRPLPSRRGLWSGSSTACAPCR